MTTGTTAVTAPRTLPSSISELEIASSAGLLPEPNAAPVAVSGDGLTQLLMALKAASESSFDISNTRIRDTQGELSEKLAEFIEQVREAAAKLREAHDDGGGLFGDFIDAVGSVAGEVFGTIADAVVDLAKSPYDVTKAVVTNFGDTQAMLAALGDATLKLVQNGSTAADVKGFTQGVVSFCGDLSEYLSRYQVEAGLAALRGENPLDVLKSDAKAVWQSLKSNILENPQFWAVTGAIAKCAAVAAAVTSGGVLAPVALGLLIALEVDKHTGFIEKAVGEKAAPWVRMGMSVAAAGCLGLSALGSNSGSLVQALQAGTGLVQSAGTVYQGYRTIQLANQQAEQIEQQAAISQTMNRMQQLQRLLDHLLGNLESDSKDAEKTQERGVRLLETQAATNAALILPA